MKYAIKFAYDGRDFSGFQRQPDDRTVQGEIEKVLGIIFQEEVSLHASGRTDTGVHALNQVATFCPAILIKEEDLTRALRRMLPRDIKLVQLCRCSKDFHPRFDAIGKHYRYICSLEDHLFERPYVHYLKVMPDMERILRAAAFLIGVHDFRAFSNRRRGERDTRRDLWAIEVKEHKERICFDLYGDGFLYRMARVIVQYLLHVGLGKFDAEETPQILASGSREKTRLCAPAHALYLMDVYYRFDPFA